MSFSSQPPFAEVLGSELLLNGLSFSPFRGCFGQVLFSPVFDYGFQKRCKGVHFVDLGESFLFEQIANSNEYLLAKFGFDAAENETLGIGNLTGIWTFGRVKILIPIPKFPWELGMQTAGPVSDSEKGSRSSIAQRQSCVNLALGGSPIEHEQLSSRSC